MLSLARSAALLVLASATLCASEPMVVHVSAFIVHTQVRSSLTPEYPQESARAGHAGVAVADVHVSAVGSVLDVKLLEAPDPAIGSAVVKAVSKWTFAPVVTAADKTPVEFIGRVMFSFSLKSGVPTVVDLVAEHNNSKTAVK